MADSSSPIQNVPPEIFGIITQHCDLKTCIKLTEVCRLFRQIIVSDHTNYCLDNPTNRRALSEIRAWQLVPTQIKLLPPGHSSRKSYEKVAKIVSQNFSSELKSSVLLSNISGQLRRQQIINIGF